MSIRTSRSTRQVSRLRAVVADASRHVAGLTASLTENDHAAPLGRLPKGAGIAASDVPTVRLATARMLWQVTDALQDMDHAVSSRPLALDRFADRQLALRNRTAARTAQTAGTDSGIALGRSLGNLLDELTIRLEEDDIPIVIGTAVGPLDGLSYLRRLVYRLMLHSLDVTEALRARRPDVAEGDCPLPRGPEAESVRLLSTLLGLRVPGQSIEVRIPPHAAVQIGDPAQVGASPADRSRTPTHTRGTPPTVIETDPGTFLRLGSGRLGWEEATGQGRVQASGLRADLGPLLPLLP